jgi:hypothetical protein
MNPGISRNSSQIFDIDDFTTATYRRHHETDLHWLTGALEQCTRDRKEAIVLTHHAPTFVKTSDPRNSGFCRTRSSPPICFMGPTVPLWCSGTHFCCDQIMNGTRIVSNQRGENVLHSNQISLYEFRITSFVKYQAGAVANFGEACFQKAMADPV